MMKKKNLKEWVVNGKESRRRLTNGLTDPLT